MADTQHLNVPDSKAAAAAKVAPSAPAVTRADRCCVHHYWAVVETNGTLVRGRNVLRSKRLSAGTYEVVFTDDVSQGVYVATIGRPAFSVEPAGEIGVALRCCLTGAEINHGVWVDTHDSNGTFADRAFHLEVHLD